MTEIPSAQTPRSLTQPDPNLMYAGAAFIAQHKLSASAEGGDGDVQNDFGRATAVRVLDLVNSTKMNRVHHN